MSRDSDASPAAGLDAVLDALEALQRAEAPAPGVVVERETTRVRIPADGAMPLSSALLERFYGGALRPDFAVREKKPMALDTRRCHGPFMVSVDEPPLALLDACSQIATLTHGFGHPAVIRGLYAGRFERCLWANPDTAVHHVPELAAYAEALLRLAPPALDHVCFVGAGGAEANEKALRLARLHGPAAAEPGRVRVLAFEDSFHGRTLATLGATWNPDKRALFEMRGYEAVFCKTTLADVERTLHERHAELYAVLVEPMMAEGGDVHLRREFLLGLCRLVRAHHLPLIVDEVQTGFATGGPFFWWTRLGLGGDELTAPDLLTCAKKAGVGVTLSRWPDPESNQVCVASALRGLIHLETAHEQAYLEEMLEPRMAALAAVFPDLISNPRVAGTTCAFDLPSPAAQTAFIEQRYPRGFMTYPAGARTIRFRFSASWEPRHLDDLFARVAEALRRIDDPAARAWIAEGQVGEGGDVVVRPVEERDWPAIMRIEHAAYEPARRDPESYLRGAATAGLGLVACDAASGEVLGFAFGAAIEHFRHVPGPNQDDRLGLGDTFFSVDITVSAAARARGVGRLLKRHQVAWAKDRDFAYITGRNRVGSTDAMAAINRSFGAFVVTRLTHQYEGHAEADYYRIPLRPPPAPRPTEDRCVDLACGLQQPFGPAPTFMAARELVGPTASRVNLSNYVTLDFVHYSEHLQHLCPRGTGHMYVTTSRDETVDKGLRCLRLARPGAQIAVGLEGGYVGHVTAAARSLSDPRGFGPAFDLYGWPRLPHPEDDPAATVAALDALVARVGAGEILGLVVEVVGERSGRVLRGEGASALAAACRRHDIPLVLVETASGTYRSGAGPWGVDSLPADVVPDLVLWYPGGQIGHIFASDRVFNKKPLMLISTWDGDELSAIRVHEHLRAARKLDVAAAAAALDATLVATFAGIEGAVLGGLGLYRTVRFLDAAAADSVYYACLHRGLQLGRGLPDTLVFAPPLDAGPLLGEPLRGTLVAALTDAPNQP